MTKRGNEIHLSDEIDDYGAVNSEKVEDNREEDIFKELIKEEEVKLDDTKRDNKEPQQVLVPAL